MTDSFDLNALAQRLNGDPLKAMLDARRAAEEATPPPPSTIPMPDFAPGGIIRFRCSLGCGWYHDENPSIEPTAPLRLPADFTSTDVTAAITAQATARHDRFQRRVESAIAAHFNEAHPGR